MKKQKYGLILLAFSFFVSALLVVHMPVFALGKIQFSKSNISLSENPSGGNQQTTATLSLVPEPMTQVSVTFSANAQCKLSAQGSNFANSGTVITQSDQIQFTYLAVDDNIDELSSHTCTINYSVSSSDANFDGVAGSQNITIIDDNDPPSPTYGFIYNQLSSAGISESEQYLFIYSWTPTQPPTKPVNITATADSQCSMVINNPNGNGQVAQSFASSSLKAGSTDPVVFRVLAANDASTEGPHACTINHSLSTDDRNYQGVSIEPVSVPIVDNEEFRGSFKTLDEIGYVPDLGLIDEKDANNDGTDDNQQSGVKSFINFTTTKRHAMLAQNQDGSPCEIVELDAVSEMDSGSEDEAFQYPQGLFDFSVNCGQNGTTATITLLLDSEYSGTEYLKLRKLFNDGRFETIDTAMFTTFETQSGAVTAIEYMVEDGSELDDDGEANGIIIDPVGIATEILDASGLPVDAPIDSLAASRARSNQFFGLAMILTGSIVISTLGYYGWRYRYKLPFINEPVFDNENETPPDEKY